VQGTPEGAGRTAVLTYPGLLEGVGIAAIRT